MGPRRRRWRRRAVKAALVALGSPSHLERRLAVRNTWGGNTWPDTDTPPSRTVFVLGVSTSPREQREVLEEWRQHRDILQGDFLDTYANLTWKTLLLLRWSRSCCEGTPFLLKADDDVFVNVPAVAAYLTERTAPPSRLYLGRVHWRVTPNRDPRSRHHVPARLYPGGSFPPYCSGTAYVLSRRAALAVLAEAPGVAPELPEDAWVGVCAGRAGVAVRHSARFGGSWRFPADGCCVGRVLFSAHGVRPGEMRKVWAERPGGCGVLRGALGVTGCRLMALGAWLWGEGRGHGE
ncbi:beta-1,3-galactosyltransferase 4 [Poecile atricapillus]|uniref:beta-1,3-galactosyltransferase 4 n=1 Tax=Poecile atricapillus TaxID=48891 RepID=UPI002739F423|nr:beta-1,3-galactosyltransferase 4 [Poecile atricapillus]